MLACLGSLNHTLGVHTSLKKFYKFLKTNSHSDMCSTPSDPSSTSWFSRSFTKANNIKLLAFEILSPSINLLDLERTNMNKS